MNIHGIYHKPKSNYCYAYDGERVDIRIRTARNDNDIDKVTLVHGDKYHWEETSCEVEMNIKYRDKHFDYYTVSIKPVNKRLSYYFIIHSEGEKYYYTEWGISENLDKEELYLHFFNYPYINNIDVHKVPEWVKNAVFYQIFPERFFNGDTSNDPDNLTKWGELPKHDSFYGGDLEGIIQKLDYIEELGINAIYLTPIFQSPTNHKYNITDYCMIDKNFGNMDTLKRLVAKCHDKKIKVILDAVFNHSGYDFMPFRDVVKRGEDSPYYDWFHIKKWPLEYDPPSYDAFAFVRDMPKLNTENKEVRDYLFKIATYWIKEADIDGWRLDVANEVDHSFWREFRKKVKEVKDDAYIVGEIWHDSLPWLMGDQFDAIMNYPFTRACLEFFAYRNIESAEFRELIDNVLMRNTGQVNEVMLNLLDSHDTARFLTKSNGDKNRLKLASVFQLTYPGAPCIYYGTEVGLEGDHDPDCRRTMPWDEEKWDNDLLEHFKKLTNMRKRFKAVRTGDFKWIKLDKNIVSYMRELEDEKILILINNNDKDIIIDLSEFNERINLYDNRKVEIDENNKLILSPFSFKIIQIN